MSNEQEQGNDNNEATPAAVAAADMDTLMMEEDWDAFMALLTEHPEEAKRIVNPAWGWTRLHHLCDVGSTPANVIALVARLYPDAVTMPDTRYGDTPLHLAARHSQTSAAKVQQMLACIENDTQRTQGVLVRNQFGGTALHSAANHNAVLAVLQALVQANPRIVHVATRDGIHAIAALYTAYIQTIPGYMAVARILKGQRENAAGEVEGHFLRFWSKAVFLTTIDQTTTATANNNDSDASSPGRLVLHGLLQKQILVNFYKLALKWDPTLAAVPSPQTGNLPLHVLVERRPFRLKEKEAIEATLQAYPAAASVRNNVGDLPLFLAIRNRMPFFNGVDLILEACRSSVTYRDPETNLLPFQLAAAVGGKVAVDNIFHLLLTQPDLLSA